MHTTILATFLEISRTVVSTYTAGIALLVIGALTARNDVAKARGLDRVVALSNLFFALPLAVFGAEHFSAARGIMQGVPKFMPWPLFWTYFVGVALLAASLSIATKIQVRWSGLLFGIMMFLFVAMMDLPGTLAALLAMVGRTGANLVDVQHIREGLDLHIQETAVQLVLETRGAEHAAAVRAAIEAGGYREATEIL